MEKKKQNIIIVGLSTTAEHAYIFIKQYDLYNVIGFAVDKKYKNKETYLGLPVFAIEDLDTVIDKEKDYIFVALFWNKLNSERRNLYERLKSQGYKFANLISPTAKIRGELTGDNCWFHDYTIVQNGAKIGSDIMAMAFAFVGGDTIVSDHCFLGAKSTVAGECFVGEQSFIGINSTVFDNRKVGKKCIVGACTFVKRDLPDFSVCKTDISSMVVKQYEEDVIESKLQFKLNKH